MARNAAVTQIIVVAIPSTRVEKFLVSGAGAYFLAETEPSLVAGANPGGLQKLDLDERNASVAQNAAVTQI